jgi:hypothetical protein
VKKTATENLEKISAVVAAEGFTTLAIADKVK